MEIPRHWRLKKQRYNLEGIRVIKKDGTVEYQFPPRSNQEYNANSGSLNKGVFPSPPDKASLSVLLGNSGEFPSPPDEQVVHSVVVYQNEYQGKE